MSKVKSNRVINGTFGAVWVNGEKWLDVESFNATVTIDYEDVNMAEDLATHQKQIGWTGDGTLTVKKVYSRGAALLAESTKQGITPDISIVGKVADPDAFGSERVALSAITFASFVLLAFEQKTLGNEEMPFRFARYNMIDLITA